MLKLQEQVAIIERHQKSWPVQTVPIAKDLGLTVFRVNNWDGDRSGMIVKDERGGSSGYAIFVNASHPPVRRRFTIAHEIGHFVLHKSLIGDGIVEDGLWRAGNLSNTIEAQANRFAADLLMPWHLLERAQEEGLFEVAEMAEAFNVSRDAMSIRLFGVPYKDDWDEATGS